jgi:hypothetical protein
MQTKKLLLLSGIVGGAAAVSRMPSVSQRLRGLVARLKEGLHARMGRMLEKMPEDSPPRLIMSTLPRLTEQNSEILSLLREQNDLLREFAATREGTGAI